MRPLPDRCATTGKDGLRLERAESNHDAARASDSQHGGRPLRLPSSGVVVKHPVVHNNKSCSNDMLRHPTANAMTANKVAEHASPKEAPKMSNMDLTCPQDRSCVSRRVACQLFARGLAALLIPLPAAQQLASPSASAPPPAALQQTQGQGPLPPNHLRLQPRTWHNVKGATRPFGDPTSHGGGACIHEGRTVSGTYLLIS